MTEKIFITTENERINLFIEESLCLSFHQLAKPGQRINSNLGEGEIIGVGETRNFGLRLFVALDKDLVKGAQRVSYWPSWFPGEAPSHISFL
ncbi:MAG: hypothetical protein KC516_04355 [Nanoarchaeota archaeon]|nr:hypothetical protein [Nanoarchaeota archaeon]